MFQSTLTQADGGADADERLAFAPPLINPEDVVYAPAPSLWLASGKRCAREAPGCVVVGLRDGEADVREEWPLFLRLRTRRS